MPRGHQNLKPGAHKLTKEEQSAGGRKSGKVRAERKALRELLGDYLDQPCGKNPQFEDLVDMLGLKSKDSVKLLFTVTCLLNSMKKGDIRDLEVLQHILGEDVEALSPDEREDDPLTKALKEEAAKMEAADNEN